MMKKALSKIYVMVKGIGVKFNALTIYSKIILFVLVCFSLLWFIPIKVLLATNFRTNDYIKSWRIKDGESFIVEYTHSVQLTPVSELYTIDKNNIILSESYFQSYGAGLPSTTPYSFEITEKGFRIYEINEIMEYLIYRTGAERANHRLILRDKEYTFLEFTEPRVGVEFNIQNMSIIRYIAREGFN